MSLVKPVAKRRALPSNTLDLLDSRTVEQVLNEVVREAERRGNPVDDVDAVVHDLLHDVVEMDIMVTQGGLTSTKAYKRIYDRKRRASIKKDEQLRERAKDLRNKARADRYKRNPQAHEDDKEKGRKRMQKLRNERRQK